MSTTLTCACGATRTHDCVDGARVTRCDACQAGQVRATGRASYYRSRERQGHRVTPRAPEPVGTGEFRNDGWLSGFIAGEGCFCIVRDHGGFTPTFSLKLRDDDGAILRAVQRDFGGNLHFSQRPTDRSGEAQ